MEEVTLAEHGRANEVVRPAAVDDAAIDKALEWITNAKHPVAVTEPGEERI